MIGFRYVPKASFFDRTGVIKAMDRKTKRVLSRFGAFVRRGAQTSIRKRKTVSAPGGPPHGHTQDLRKRLFFSYDADKRSVVIGPLLYKPREYSVPEVLEEGGLVAVKQGGVVRVLRYRPRPYMKPAFDKVLPQVARWYAGDFSKGK